MADKSKIKFTFFSHTINIQGNSSSASDLGNQIQYCDVIDQLIADEDEFPEYKNQPGYIQKLYDSFRIFLTLMRLHKKEIL